MADICPKLTQLQTWAISVGSESWRGWQTQNLRAVLTVQKQLKFPAAKIEEITAELIARELGDE